MNLDHEFQSLLTRRHFFGRLATGIGTTALASLLNERLFADETTPVHNALGTLGSLHFAPKAKRVIYLFMSGGPSHIDLFDYILRQTESQTDPAFLLLRMATMYRARFGPKKMKQEMRRHPGGESCVLSLGDLVEWWGFFDAEVRKEIAETEASKVKSPADVKED